MAWSTAYDAEAVCIEGSTWTQNSVRLPWTGRRVKGQRLVQRVESGLGRWPGPANERKPRSTSNSSDPSRISNVQGNQGLQ